MAVAERAGDPLVVLRTYRQLAPWNLRDLATLTGAILESAGIRPINAAASTTPSERTIRFYVTRGLVTPPDGRGTAATYSYRHLLEVLAIKLRQMEGGTLSAIAEEMRVVTGDVIERRVAAALGTGLPLPRQLPLLAKETPPAGRHGRALHHTFAAAAPAGLEPAPPQEDAGRWRRLLVAEGVELHVREDHPLLVHGDNAELRHAVRLLVGRLTARRPAPGAGNTRETAS